MNGHLMQNRPKDPKICKHNSRLKRLWLAWMLRTASAPSWVQFPRLTLRNDSNVHSKLTNPDWRQLSVNCAQATSQTSFGSSEYPFDLGLFICTEYPSHLWAIFPIYTRAYILINAISFYFLPYWTVCATVCVQVRLFSIRSVGSFAVCVCIAHRYIHVWVLLLLLLYFFGYIPSALSFVGRSFFNLSTLECDVHVSLPLSMYECICVHDCHCCCCLLLAVLLHRVVFLCFFSSSPSSVVRRAECYTMLRVCRAFGEFLCMEIDSL